MKDRAKNFVTTLAALMVDVKKLVRPLLVPTQVMMVMTTVVMAQVVMTTVAMTTVAMVMTVRIQKASKLY